MTDAPMPPHPYWCDECGSNSPFTIKGSPIEHDTHCSRYGEDADVVYNAARVWCLTTGRSIP